MIKPRIHRLQHIQDVFWEDKESPDFVKAGKKTASETKGQVAD
jgi:hypothetical protein